MHTYIHENFLYYDRRHFPFADGIEILTLLVLFGIRTENISSHNWPFCLALRIVCKGRKLK